MRCLANIDYHVIRRNENPYWKEPSYTGEIVSLDCNYCDFQVTKRGTGKPRSSKSGLGRYNRMRAKIVKHLHEEHRHAMLIEMSEQDRGRKLRQWEM
ncbi:MAG: hypothetical protein GTO24_21060 [candidate division Zixibacteria bacterium]|nr:hypothetical protein [candidate division Zixibacteria bacterium]